MIPKGRKFYGLWLLLCPFQSTAVQTAAPNNWLEISNIPSPRWWLWWGWWWWCWQRWWWQRCCPSIEYILGVVREGSTQNQDARNHFRPELPSVGHQIWLGGDPQPVGRVGGSSSSVEPIPRGEDFNPQLLFQGGWAAPALYYILVTASRNCWKWVKGFHQILTPVGFG